MHNATVLNNFSWPAYYLDSGEIVHEVHDWYGTYQGYVSRVDTRKPKALTFCGEYCRMHFPRNAVHSKSLVLVEDIPSAEMLSMFIPTAAVLGSFVTKDQVSYMLACGIQSITLCFDDDAAHKSSSVARELSSVFRTSSVFCSPDPKDMNYEELQKLIHRIQVGGTA